MADTKFEDLTTDNTPLLTDILPYITDPGGSPLARKTTFAGLLTLALSNVAVQVITAGTTVYTPTALMKSALVFCQGGGGGTPAETGTDAAVGGGGGGGCAIRLYTAAEIGASEACVVGATSTGAGNDSTFSAGGTLITGSGGAVGVVVTSATAGAKGAGGAGGAATGGSLNIPGESGDPGLVSTTALKWGGKGGSSFLGTGGRGGWTDTTAEQGSVGNAYGGGAGGGITHDGTDLTAVAGAAGVIWIIEFLA